jgi:hypothetical protein
LMQRAGCSEVHVTLLEPDVATIAEALDRQVELERPERLPVQGFDWSTMARQFEAVYQSIR